MERTRTGFFCCCLINKSNCHLVSTVHDWCHFPELETELNSSMTLGNNLLKNWRDMSVLWEDVPNSLTRFSTCGKLPTQGVHGIIITMLNLVASCRLLFRIHLPSLPRRSITMRTAVSQVSRHPVGGNSWEGVARGWRLHRDTICSLPKSDFPGRKFPAITAILHGLLIFPGESAINGMPSS